MESTKAARKPAKHKKIKVSVFIIPPEI